MVNVVLVMSKQDQLYLPWAVFYVDYELLKRRIQNILKMSDGPDGDLELEASKRLFQVRICLICSRAFAVCDNSVKFQCRLLNEPRKLLLFASFEKPYHHGRFRSHPLPSVDSYAPVPSKVHIIHRAACLY